MQTRAQTTQAKSRLEIDKGGNQFIPMNTSIMLLGMKTFARQANVKVSETINRCIDRGLIDLEDAPPPQYVLQHNCRY